MGARENVIYRAGIYPLSCWETEEGGWLPRTAEGKGAMGQEAQRWRLATDGGDKAEARRLEKQFKEQGFLIERTPSGTLWSKQGEGVASRHDRRAKSVG
jgi:hypothetical protein